MRESASHVAKILPLPTSESVTPAPPNRRLPGIRAMLASRAFFPILAVLIGAYYELLITAGRFALWGPAIRPSGSGVNYSLGFVFNDMLLRLLRWDFTIDPAIIKWEAVFWGGKTYAYFGVMPALLRVVLLPFFDLTKIDVSPLSMWVAAILAVLFKVAALRIVITNRRAQEPSGMLAWALLMILVLAGAPLQFLKVSVYQEPILWEGVCASAFLALALLGLMDKAGFSSFRLQLMALAAGCCLLTRVVMATGMYVALLLLLVLLFRETLRSRRAAQSQTAGGGESAGPERFRLSVVGRFVLPLVILTIFAGAAGLVNAKRFGNPLVFHRPTRHLIIYPNGAQILERYGEFNLRRVPYALMYYFAPVWFLHGSDGEFLFADYQREVDLVEPPPSSFLLSDTLLLLLAIVGVCALMRRGGLAVDRGMAAVIAGGLAIPPLLMLTAYAMTFRYRMEYYPVLEFLALLGGFAAVRAPIQLASWPKSVMTLAVLGIITSHLLLVAYRASPYGSLDRSQHLYRIYDSVIKHRVGLGP
jgi:hypothetical protein